MNPKELSKERLEEIRRMSQHVPHALDLFDHIAWQEAQIAERDGALRERIAQLTAHRACCGTEHDPANGKLHGYCIVCGVPWPCDYAGESPPTHK